MRKLEWETTRSSFLSFIYIHAAHSLIRTASSGPEGELGILGMYRPPQPLSGHAGASPLSTASCSGK